MQFLKRMSRLSLFGRQEADRGAAEPEVSGARDEQSDEIDEEALLARLAEISERLIRSIGDDIGEYGVLHNNLDTSSNGQPAPLLDLQNVRVDGDRYASCRANLFYSTWSRRFAHGSDTMLPITTLTERILRLERGYRKYVKLDGLSQANLMLILKSRL